MRIPSRILTPAKIPEGVRFAAALRLTFDVEGGPASR